MSGISRINDALHRRYPRAYITTCFVAGLATLVGFAAWDIMRVRTSPIRGTSAWTAGLVLGGGTGVVTTLAWAWLAWRTNLDSYTWRPWQWASSILLMIALVTTHSKGGEQPRVVGAYSVGALSYLSTSFVGICLVYSLLGLKRMRRRWRIRHPRERAIVVVQRRPLSKRGKRKRKGYRAP